jgi:hypothetical protein
MTTAADDHGSDGMVISEGTQGTQKTQGRDGDTDPSGCDPSECAELGEDSLNEYGWSFDCDCTDDDVCVCEPPSGECRPCGPCREWETCYDDSPGTASANSFVGMIFRVGVGPISEGITC